MIWIRSSINTKHHESRKNKDIPSTSDSASCEITTLQTIQYTGWIHCKSFLTGNTEFSLHTFPATCHRCHYLESEYRMMTNSFNETLPRSNPTPSLHKHETMRAFFSPPMVIQFQPYLMQLEDCSSMRKKKIRHGLVALQLIELRSCQGQQQNLICKFPPKLDVEVPRRHWQPM